MATLRKLKSSKNWIAQFRDANGKLMTRSTRVADTGTSAERAKARASAKRIADQFERTARGETVVEAQLRKALFEIYEEANQSKVQEKSIRQFFDDYIDLLRKKVDLKQRSQSTLIRYEGTVNRFLEVIGESRAAASFDTLQVEDFENFRDKRLAEAGGNTIKNDFKVLNAPLAAALRKGFLTVNPLASVDLEKVEAQDHLPFSLDEMKFILAACRDPDLKVAGDHLEWEIAITAGLYTGLRLADIASLIWSEVDLEKKKTTLIPRKGRRIKKKVTIPMHPSLHLALLRLPSSDSLDTLLFPSLQPNTEKRKETADFSFLSKRFNKIVDHAGVDPCIIIDPQTGHKFRQKSFHSLRSSFNSILAEKGINQELRMILTGHTTKRVNDRYTKFSWIEQENAVKEMPNV